MEVRWKIDKRKVLREIFCNRNWDMRNKKLPFNTSPLGSLDHRPLWQAKVQSVQSRGSGALRSTIFRLQLPSAAVQEETLLVTQRLSCRIFARREPSRHLTNWPPYVLLWPNLWSVISSSNHMCSCYPQKIKLVYSRPILSMALNSLRNLNVISSSVSETFQPSSSTPMSPLPSSIYDVCHRNQHIHVHS